MSTQPRWLKSAIAASAGPVPALPWQRSAIFLPIPSVNAPPPAILAMPLSPPRLLATG